MHVIVSIIIMAPNPRLDFRYALDSAELEDYAQSFFKYSVVPIEDQSTAIRNFPDRELVMQAYRKVENEHFEHKKRTIENYRG